MGLPAGQRRALEKIEHALRASDPRLASLFAVFGRLTRDEEMPRIEQLRHRVAAAVLRVRLALTFAGQRHRTRRAGRRHARQRFALFFPLALAQMALTIIVASRFGGAGTCTATTAASSAARQTPGSRLCRPMVLTPGSAGR